MKPRYFFILSLGLNLALAAVFVALLRNPPAPTFAASDGAAPLPAPVVATNPPAAAVAAPVATTSPFQWRMIESADYRRYIANLRAIGCPERTIRDIIVADLDQLYATKNRSAPADPPPWQNAEHRRVEDRARAASRSALRTEKRALVRELIGYEWDNHANEQWHEDFITGLLLGFLPDPKAPQLLSIAGKYTELAENVREDANNILIDEDRARLRQLYDGLVGEASRLLSPAEREELELRIQAAGFFSGSEDIHWDGVAITGPELREFVRLSKSCQDAFQSHFLGLADLSVEEQAARKSAFERQVEHLLGPARFADYRRAQDSDFRETFEFAQEHNLPGPAAIRIHAVRRAAEEQAGRLKSNKSLSPAEQSESLAALKSATTGTVSSALGKSYAEYLNGPGQWLEALVAPPEPIARNNPP